MLWTSEPVPQLDVTDYLLLVSLVPLLVASGFFSASETVFFGLRTDDRTAIRRRGGLIAIAVEGLLRDPRRLLVTILLGNMTVNTVYMTVSSMLMLRHGSTPLAGVFFGLFTLFAVISYLLSYGSHPSGIGILDTTHVIASSGLAVLSRTVSFHGAFTFSYCIIGVLGAAHMG